MKGQPTQFAHGGTIMGPPQRDTTDFAMTTSSSIKPSTYPPSNAFSTSSSSSSISPNGTVQDTSTNLSPLASSSSVWRDCPTLVGCKTTVPIVDQGTRSGNVHEECQGQDTELGQEQGVAEVESNEKGNEKESDDDGHGLDSVCKGEEEGSHELKGDDTMQS